MDPRQEIFHAMNDMLDHMSEKEKIKLSISIDILYNLLFDTLPMAAKTKVNN